jgi:hypothetical protein
MTTRLRNALANAWNDHTSTAAPDAWLDATVTALTQPTSLSDPVHRHDDPAVLARCATGSLNELRRLHDEARQAQAGTARRQRALTDLKTQVRQRALDTLTDNPDLDGDLRDALTAWNLPGIPTDHTVQVTVPLTVTVPATDHTDAEREAIRLLERRVSNLGYDITANLTAAHCLVADE